MKRDRVIQRLAEMILKLPPTRPQRVGIDGVDCSGKTTLAGELANVLKAAGRTIIQASIDGFHNPAEVRKQQGDLSPKGYYEDSFDLEALRALLLDPLATEGARRIQTALYDVRTEAAVESPKIAFPDSGILVFEGVFLHRPELLNCWDFSIYVESSFETTLERALTRDSQLFGSEEATRQRYLERYIPGQQLYLRQCAPQDRADVIVDNNNPSSAVITSVRAR